MKFSVLALLLLVAVEAPAAVVCVQNKQTGDYQVAAPAGAAEDSRCGRQPQAPAGAVVSVQAEVEAAAATPARPAAAATAAAEASVAHAPAVVAKTAPAGVWMLKLSHRTLREAVEDWASQAGYDVVWKIRDFPLDFLKKDKLVSNGDLWQALTLLGEAYRNSDDAFQIQPTEFHQLVVLPMSRSNSADTFGAAQ